MKRETLMRNLVVLAAVVLVSLPLACSPAPTPTPTTAPTAAMPSPIPTATTTANAAETPEGNPHIDALNTSYLIDGRPITLTNGVSEIEIVPGAASKTRTVAWGQPVTGDLNGDGVEDAVLIVSQNSGGSGTFYYVVVALRDRASGAMTGTNGVLLGDRIVPKNLFITGGTIMAMYDDRERDDPMSTTPYIGITKALAVEGSVLKEVLLTK
jgi:hypothetical protein